MEVTLLERVGLWEFELGMEKMRGMVCGRVGLWELELGMEKTMETERALGKVRS